MPPRFLQSELPERPAGECRFHVLPVPYEATVSYGNGTANGPAAILEASNQLEVRTGRSMPCEQGIYTWPAVECSGPAETVLERIEAAVRAALAAGPQQPLPVAPPCSCSAAAVLPVVLGGEHTVTLGVLRALKKQYGNFGVVQFDAHADLRDTYEGSPYSHACVMRRAVEDLELPLFQIGVRSLSPEEARFREERNIPRLDARNLRPPLRPDHASDPAHSLPVNGQSLLPEDFPPLIFLTFDVDAFDSSLMPATGTPEPGGLFWWDVLELAERALAGRVCLGFDITELAPVAGLHAPTYAVARLAHEFMGLFAPGVAEK